MQDALFGDEEVVDPTWSVADLSKAIGSVLEQAFPGEIWVRGEIRELPPPGDGRRARPHLYFDLIEPAPPGQRPRAVLPVVLWSTDRRRVNADLRRSGSRVSAMDNGVDVRIRGRIRWWAPGGRPQLQMTGIDPEYTLGRLAADRAAVLAALDADGLLDRNGRLRLPPVPARVGLVTSLGSAAQADVRRVLEAAGLSHLLVEADARTQGPAAADTVPAAIEAVVAAGAELVLLVRGGGSRVELAAFDVEVIARAVATCPVPVVTGIGHEIDDSVADRVAHTACATPTGAAALVVAGVGAARDRTEALWAAIGAAARRATRAEDEQLARRGRQIVSHAGGSLRAAEAGHRSLSTRLRQRGPAGLARADARLDVLGTSLGRGVRRDLGDADRRVTAAAAVLARRPGPMLDRAGRELVGVEARVRAVDPARALARGWSMTYRADGTLVRSTAEVTMGDELVTHLAVGRVRSQVVGTEADEGGSADG
jgi:exodeoxyribonuclease VII large subunit